MIITAFLPCRAGSERVPNKNTRKFVDVEGGLLEIKLRQLLKVDCIDQILLSSNDPSVFKIAKRISSEIKLDERPEYLALSSTSTDELIKYVPSIIKQGHVLWTHTTSPFLTEHKYNEAIENYKNCLVQKEYDSLMTVNKLHTFIWDEKKPINYNRDEEKWPRTQTLKNLYEVNSGIFINSVDNYTKYNDRIGLNPYLMVNEGFSNFDIDWQSEFDMAEIIYKKIHS